MGTAIFVIVFVYYLTFKPSACITLRIIRVDLKWIKIKVHNSCYKLDLLIYMYEINLLTI